MNTVVKTTTKTTGFREKSAILLGESRSNVWLVRLNWFNTGTPHSVSFDWQLVMNREEEYGDVAGFYHSHPDGHFVPSERDHQTMYAWSSCFGKPLLCVIECQSKWRAFEFTENDCVELTSAVPFARRRLVIIR